MMTKKSNITEKINELKDQFTTENAEQCIDDLCKIGKKAKKGLPIVVKREIKALENRVKKEKKKLDKILTSIEKIKKEEISSLVNNFVDGKGLKITKTKKKKKEEEN